MKVYGLQFAQALKQATENCSLVRGLSQIMKVDEESVRRAIHYPIPSGRELDNEATKLNVLDGQVDKFESIAQLVAENGLSGDVANAMFFIAGRLSQAREITSLRNNDSKLRDYSAAARNTLRVHYLDHITQYPELEQVNL